MPADVLEAIDGDTLRVIAHPWPGVDLRVNVRLRGIDAPELHGRCPAEIAAARAARAALAGWAGRAVLLTAIAHDKYAGRVLATVIAADGRDLAARALQARTVRSYDGGTRGGWCGTGDLPLR